MKKGDNNIIQFPIKEKYTVEDYDLDSTYHVFDVITDELEELGYDVEDLQLKKDIAVLANLLFASFQRNHKNNDHVFHFVLDECDVMIAAAKDYMDLLETKKQDNVIDDGNPTNDNNRL
jgi:hypothetical protein